jgi:DnaJ-class molecular chaperone
MTLAEQIARIIDPWALHEGWSHDTATRIIAIVREASQIIVCPQCEGEGGYPDGLDEDACHTQCTRCLGEGRLVDIRQLGTAP